LNIISTFASLKTLPYGNTYQYRKLISGKIVENERIEYKRMESINNLPNNLRFCQRFWKYKRRLYYHRSWRRKREGQTSSFRYSRWWIRCDSKEMIGYKIEEQAKHKLK